MKNHAGYLTPRRGVAALFLRAEEIEEGAWTADERATCGTIRGRDLTVTSTALEERNPPCPKMDRSFLTLRRQTPS